MPPATIGRSLPIPDFSRSTSDRRWTDRTFKLTPRTVATIPAALMLALGLWGLHRGGSMWRDESTTYQVAHRELPEIGHMLGNVDLVHGLYYLLMHGVFTVWDGGLTTLRLPSLLAMAATAAAVALLGYRLAGPGPGLAAGLVFTLNPEVQRYAQEGRSYALVCAFVVWSTHLLVRAITRGNGRVWVAYAGVCLTACLLHEFAVLVLLAHGATLVWAQGPRVARRGWMRAAGGVVLGLLPVAVLSQRQSAQVAWISSTDGGEIAGFAAVVLLGVVCAAAPIPKSGAVRLARIALPLLVLPPMALLVLSLHQPLYVRRYVLYSHVGLSLLLGAALCWVLGVAFRKGPPRMRGIGFGPVAVSLAALAILATSLLAMVYLRTPGSRTDDVVATAHTVRELSTPGDGLLFAPGRRRESLMSFPENHRGLIDLALSRDAVTSGTLHGVELPARDIRSRMLAARRIVVVADPPDEPQDSTAQEITKRSVLAESFEVCASRRVLRLVVTAYARPGHCRADLGSAYGDNASRHPD